MSDNPNQPRVDDAVLGGQVPIPRDSAILGGIEGVKRRLASAVEQQRIAALSDALKYGEAGLDLVIQVLQNESWLVESAAYGLLRERAEPRVKQALQQYDSGRPFKYLCTWGGHSSFVNSVAISPDGETLVSGSGDNTIKLWNLHTGELRHTLIGHSGSVYCVAITPDGETLVSGSADKTITVWNLHTGELRNTLTGHSSWVNCVAISADGKILVSCSNYEITVRRVR